MGSGRPISLIVPERSYFSKVSKGNNLGELILKRQSTTRRTLERVVAVPVQTYAEYSGFQFTSVDQVDIVGVPESVPFLLAGDSGSVIVSRQKILLLTLI